jgi:hypothetical protein
MATALTPVQQSTALTLAADPRLPAPVDKKALRSYLAVLEDPEALELQQRLAAAYDKACAALIGENDVQKEGKREFKKKSAWRKLGRYFGVSTEVVKIEREFVGEVFVATVTVRGTAAWGQVTEAIGSCGTDEATGRREISIADAIATAETRATNRATSNLIAMGEVSAEEVRQDGSGRGPAERRLSLEEANALTWPWKEPAKYKGKTLGEVSTDMLLRMSEWAEQKLEAGTAGKGTRQLWEAAGLILSHRPDVDVARAALDAEKAKEAESGGQPAAGEQAATEGEQRPDPTPAPSASAAPAGPSTGSSAPAPSTSTDAPNATPSTRSATGEPDPELARLLPDPMPKTAKGLMELLVSLLDHKGVDEATRTDMLNRGAANKLKTVEQLREAVDEVCEVIRLSF